MAEILQMPSSKTVVVLQVSRATLPESHILRNGGKNVLTRIGNLTKLRKQLKIHTQTKKGKNCNLQCQNTVVRIQDTWNRGRAKDVGWDIIELFEVMYKFDLEKGNKPWNRMDASRRVGLMTNKLTKKISKEYLAELNTWLWN